MPSGTTRPGNTTRLRTGTTMTASSGSGRIPAGPRGEESLAASPGRCTPSREKSVGEVMRELSWESMESKWTPSGTVSRPCGPGAGDEQTARIRRPSWVNAQSAPRREELSRRLPIGAEVQAEGTHFRVWAPDVKRVELVHETETGSALRS